MGDPKALKELVESMNAHESAEKAWSEFKDKRCDDLDGTAYQGYVGSSAPQAYCYHKGYTSGWNAHAAIGMGEIESLKKELSRQTIIANAPETVKTMAAQLDRAAFDLKLTETARDTWRQQATSYAAELEALRAEADRMKEALEFYAGDNWYRLENTNSIISDTDLYAPKNKLYKGQLNGGKRAKEALRPVDKKEQR